VSPFQTEPSPSQPISCFAGNPLDPQHTTTHQYTGQHTQNTTTPDHAIPPLANPTAGGTQTAPGRRPLSKATPCTHTNPSTNQAAGATRKTRLTYKPRTHNTKHAHHPEWEHAPNPHLPVFPCPCKSEPDKRYRYYHCLRLIRTPKKQATPTPIETPCSPHSFTLAATNRNTISTEKRQRRKQTQATTATDQEMSLSTCATTPHIHTTRHHSPKQGKQEQEHDPGSQETVSNNPITPSATHRDSGGSGTEHAPGNRPLRPPQNKNLATIMITGKPPTHCIPLSSSPEQVNPTIRLTTHYRALTPLINRNKNHKP